MLIIKFAWAIYIVFSVIAFIYFQFFFKPEPSFLFKFPFENKPHFTYQWYVNQFSLKTYCWNYCRSTNTFYSFFCFLTDIAVFAVVKGWEKLHFIILSYIILLLFYPMYLSAYVFYFIHFMGKFIFYYFTNKPIEMEYLIIPDNRNLAWWEIIFFSWEKIQASVFAIFYFLLSSGEKKKFLKKIPQIADVYLHLWVFMLPKWFCYRIFDLANLLDLTCSQVDLDDKLIIFWPRIILYQFKTELSFFFMYDSKDFLIFISKCKIFYKNWKIITNPNFPPKKTTSHLTNGMLREIWIKFFAKLFIEEHNQGFNDILKRFNSVYFQNTPHINTFFHPAPQHLRQSKILSRTILFSSYLSSKSPLFIGNNSAISGYPFIHPSTNLFMRSSQSFIFQTYIPQNVFSSFLMRNTMLGMGLYNRWRLLTFYHFQYQIVIRNSLYAHSHEPVGNSFVQIGDQLRDLNEVLLEGSSLHVETARLIYERAPNSRRELTNIAREVFYTNNSRNIATRDVDFENELLSYIQTLTSTENEQLSIEAIALSYNISIMKAQDLYDQLTDFK